MTFSVSTKGQDDIINLNDRIQKMVTESGVQEGSASIIMQGSSACLVIMHDEQGLRRDIINTLNRLVPDDVPYNHNETAEDENGFAHIRSALIGVSLSVPIINGNLSLGTWQDILLIECDSRPRERQIVVAITAS